MTFADQRPPNRETEFVGDGRGNGRLDAQSKNKTGHQLDVCEGDVVLAGQLQLVNA